jgi:hypothetical protein
MQVSSVVSQVQQQIAVASKNAASKPQAPAPSQSSVDNDGDHDHGAPDKGKAVDVKG